MDIEKLDYEPGYMLNVTANITDQAIEFEERCMGEALRRWQIHKEDVLERVRESDRLRAENEKLRAELEQVKRERDAAISDLETIMAYGGGNLDTCQYCKNGQCYARGGTKLCLPQWRGQKEDCP